MPCGAETFVFLSHLFENENDQFTKTGSGQTSYEGKLGGGGGRRRFLTVRSSQPMNS
jgi:hypothetical protein